MQNLIDKKEIVILALLVLLAITGLGWFRAELEPPHENIPHENIPYNNTYAWAEIFRGYEAYLDRRIASWVIRGSSMEPTFGENDVVLVVEVDPAELKVGDIIVFDHPTRPDFPTMAHRIVEVRVQNGEYDFMTKGDHLSERDQHWLSEDKIHGLVIGVVYAATPR